MDMLKHIRDQYKRNGDTVIAFILDMAVQAVAENMLESELAETPMDLLEKKKGGLLN